MRHAALFSHYPAPALAGAYRVLALYDAFTSLNNQGRLLQTERKEKRSVCFFYSSRTNLKECFCNASSYWYTLPGGFSRRVKASHLWKQSYICTCGRGCWWFANPDPNAQGSPQSGRFVATSRWDFVFG